MLGSSPTSLFYGVDQIGSVRRVFASPTNAPAYDYDPYGVPLQATVPLTDFGYAGLITEPDSGLGLATYRAYDPRAGRWISRDPVGEKGNAPATYRSLSGFNELCENSSVENTNNIVNLYLYANANPVGNVDPDGRAVIFLGPGGGGRICGVICGGYGCRMDYAPNPGPTLLHFHFGPLSAGGSWGGHRPWYAPWRVY